jgi:hypothetical protein
VAVISGNWNDHWVFWFGPYLGAVAASLCYNYLFELKEEDVVAAAAPPLASQQPVQLLDESLGGAPQFGVTLKMDAPEAVPSAGAASTPGQEWR